LFCVAALAGNAFLPQNAESTVPEIDGRVAAWTDTLSPEKKDLVFQADAAAYAVFVCLGNLWDQLMRPNPEAEEMQKKLALLLGVAAELVPHKVSTCRENWEKEVLTPIVILTKYVCGSSQHPFVPKTTLNVCSACLGLPSGIEHCWELCSLINLAYPLEGWDFFTNANKLIVLISISAGLFSILYARDHVAELGLQAANFVKSGIESSGIWAAEAAKNAAEKAREFGEVVAETARNATKAFEEAMVTWGKALSNPPVDVDRNDVKSSVSGGNDVPGITITVTGGSSCIMGDTIIADGNCKVTINGTQVGYGETVVNGRTYTVKCFS
jgi:hypothetical protein